MIRSVAVLALLLPSSQQLQAASPTWPDKSYRRSLIEEVLPQTSERWDGDAFAQRGTRRATYVALGLLWRDGQHDRAAAATVLRGVLDLQYDDGPDSDLHGVWRRRQGETEPDSNWREFIGCGLILALETFPDRLAADLVTDMRDALLRAAQGAAERNVGAGYSNIALMSAFLLDYVGTTQQRKDLQQAGHKKADIIYELFARHKTFDEFNSPTYYGVDLMALALWREHARSQRMRALGRAMEAELWRDIGSFYHAGMRNMCGPFVRAYGMDMTRYCALVGLWIALAVGDPAQAPWPGPGGRGSGERVYAPVFALLRPVVPADVLPHLQRFVGARTFERRFKDTHATVLMERDWMMGAAFLARRWDQHHAATMHWLVEQQQPVCWILLTGLNDHVSPSVADRSLRIRRLSKSESAERIQFLVHAPALDATAVTRQRWDLPGLSVSIDIADGVRLGTVRGINHARYGRCLEVLYTVPVGTDQTAEVLTLRPQRRGIAPPAD